LNPESKEIMDIQSNEITRADLYFPNIGQPREIWAFAHDITGAVALWAVHQSPYPVPDNLETVLRKLHALCKDGFDTAGMRKFESFTDLEAFISQALRTIPEYLAWNERKNGNQNPHHFTSRYDGVGDPDDNFIDLGALERNVTMHIVQQAALL
jgi:hypothetical protein